MLTIGGRATIRGQRTLGGLGSLSNPLIDSHLGEFGQEVSQLVADATKSVELFFIRSLDGSGVLKTVMDYRGRPGKHGTTFFGVIADGQDVVKSLAVEFIYLFGAVAGNINAQLAHYGNRLRADATRFSSSAEDLETVSRVVPQQPLRHLAAR